MSSVEKTLQKVPMPPRTRSRTEILPQTENITEECLGTTANLAPVEAAEQGWLQRNLGTPVTPGALGPVEISGVSYNIMFCCQYCQN